MEKYLLALALRREVTRASSESNFAMQRALSGQEEGKAREVEQRFLFVVAL
jgi:hypothetical protein